MESKVLEDYDAVEPVIKKLIDSKLRFSILTALSEKPLRLAELRRVVEANAPNTSAKAKDLEELGLVERISGEYRLTPFGHLLGRVVVDSTHKIAKIMTFQSYWKEHDMSHIPKDLQARLAALEGIQIWDYGHEVAKSEEVFHKMLRSISGPKYYGLAPIFAKEWIPITVEKIMAGVDVKMILSKEVINSTTGALAEKEQVKLLDECPNLEVSLIEPEDMTSFVASSNFFSLRCPLKSTGHADMFKTVYGDDPDSIALGFDFFDHYVKQAEKISLTEFV